MFVSFIRLLQLYISWEKYQEVLNAIMWNYLNTFNEKIRMYKMSWHDCEII